MKQRVLFLRPQADEPASDRLRAACESLGFDCDVCAAQSSDRFERIAAADVVIVDLRSDDPDMLYVLGLVHGLGKRTSVIARGDADDMNALAAMIKSASNPLRSSSTVPLTDVLDAGTMGEPVRQYLRQRGVIRAADLGRLDLEDLARAPDVTRQALQSFVRALARSERYPDREKLQEFLIKRGIFI